MVFTELNLPYNLAIVHIPNRASWIYQPKDTEKNVLSGAIYNCTKLKTTPVTITAEWINKLCSFSMVDCKHNKRSKLQMHTGMNNKKHNIEWKKLYAKECILGDSICIKSKPGKTNLCCKKWFTPAEA